MTVVLMVVVVMMMMTTTTTTSIALIYDPPPPRHPGVLSAANEQAVQMFLDERIGYMDIFKTVEAACDAHTPELVAQPTLEEIVHYDQWARDYVDKL